MKKNDYTLPVIFMVCLFGLNTFAQNFQYSSNPTPIKRDILEIPFQENWSNGFFNPQVWTETERWALFSQEGKPSPCVRFKWEPPVFNYSHILQTNSFNGINLSQGQIILKFDMKLVNRNNTGTEFMVCEVYDGQTTWFELESWSNDNSFDWTSYEIPITEYAKENPFEIRFRAYGENSVNLISWYVDNIEVYRFCDPPERLSCNYMWDPDLNQGFTEVEWDTPESAMPPQAEWIGWHNGPDNNGIGLVGGGDFSVAARFPPESLEEYVDDTLKSIRFMLNDLDFDSVVAKIWTGEQAETLIWESKVDNPLLNNWNELELDLDEAFLISAEEYLWVGYAIYGQLDDAFPAAADLGPAITGLGDMISRDDGITWDAMSEISSLDFNWTINAFIIPGEGSGTNPVGDLMGFDLYNSVDESEYSYLDFVPHQNQNTSYSYEHFDIEFDNSACYKVQAVWASQGDTCYSEFAKSLANPYSNEACLLFPNYVSLNENNEGGQIQLMPNPAKDFVRIVSPQKKVLSIKLYDMQSKLIKTWETNADQFEIELNGINSGLYTIIIQGESFIETKKLIIQAK